jgi:hypothetical protein
LTNLRFQAERSVVGQAYPGVRRFDEPERAELGGISALHLIEVLAASLLAGSFGLMRRPQSTPAAPERFLFDPSARAPGEGSLVGMGATADLTEGRRLERDPPRASAILGAAVALAITAAVAFAGVSVYLWQQAGARHGTVFAWLAIGTSAGILISISVALLAYVLLRTPAHR